MFCLLPGNLGPSAAFAEMCVPFSKRNRTSGTRNIQVLVTGAGGAAGARSTFHYPVPECHVADASSCRLPSRTSGRDLGPQAVDTICPIRCRAALGVWQACPCAVNNGSSPPRAAFRHVHLGVATPDTLATNVQFSWSHYKYGCFPFIFFFKGPLTSLKCSHPYKLLRKTVKVRFYKQNNLKALPGVLPLFQCSLKGFFAINFLTSPLLTQNMGEMQFFKQKFMKEQTIQQKEKHTHTHPPTQLSWVGSIRLYKWKHILYCFCAWTSLLFNPRRPYSQF